MAIKALRRSTISSPKHIRRKKRIFWWQVGLTHVAIASLVFALYAAFHYEPFIISTVHIDGVQTIETAAISQEVTSALAGAYALGIIPKTNTLFYPKGEVLKQLREKWPEIEDLHVARQGAQAVSVLVRERQPHYIWCSAPDIPAHESHGDTACLYADENGYLYSVAPQLTSLDARSPTMYKNTMPHPLIVSMTDEEKGIRDIVLPADLFKKLTTYIEQVEPLVNAPVRVVYIRPEHQAEAVLNSGLRILFTLDQDSSLALTNLGLFLKKQSGPFEYVDIRYSNKVYFKALR